jgi:hypothetical protein
MDSVVSVVICFLLYFLLLISANSLTIKWFYHPHLELRLLDAFVRKHPAEFPGIAPGDLHSACYDVHVIGVISEYHPDAPQNIDAPYCLCSMKDFCQGDVLFHVPDNQASVLAYPHFCFHFFNLTSFSFEREKTRVINTHYVRIFDDRLHKDGFN